MRGWRRGRDCLAHPWAKPLRASRCGASLRLSKFAPGEFVDCGGRMPERTSAQPMARRVRPRMGRITGRVRPHLPLRQKRKRPQVVRSAVCMTSAGIVRPIHGSNPSALCAPGPACGCPNSLLANLSNREGSSTPPSPPETQKAPFGAFCVSGGEGGIRTLGRLFTYA